MNKPLTMAIKETKEKIANICNDSGLPLAILDLIMQGIYSEIRFLAEKQSLEEERNYIKANMHEEKDNYETQKQSE